MKVKHFHTSASQGSGKDGGGRTGQGEGGCSGAHGRGGSWVQSFGRIQSPVLGLHVPDSGHCERLGFMLAILLAQIKAVRPLALR